MIRVAACARIALCVARSASSALAEEVATRFRGLTLRAGLQLADGRGLEDGVALIVHDALAFSGDATIAALQQNLGQRGVSTLAITLSLGQDRRTGGFECDKPHISRAFDALDEIDAWIGWLKNNGAADIALIGHGQGGNQAAVYVAERRDPSVSGLALLAPSTFERARVAEAYNQLRDADLADVLSRAQGLVQSGQGVERLTQVGFLNCTAATVTAGAFVSWYGPSPLRDTPTVLARTMVRTLVVVAGDDAEFPDLAAAVAGLKRGAELQVETIDGADHAFSGEAGANAAEAIAEWLKG